MIDLYLTYSFLRKLATPFSEWEAYKLGIIDQEGNELRSISSLKTVREREAYGYFDRIVRKLKVLLGKIPGGASRIGSYAAALWFIKENHDQSDDEILRDLRESMRKIELVEEINALFEELVEEAPVNSSGSGNVAGIGVGPDGEPGRKRKKRWLLKNT